MTATVRKTAWAVAGVVLMAVSAMAMSPAAPRFAGESQRPVTWVRPYAQITVVKLGTLMPLEPGAPDVDVRLIAVEGEVLLPPDFSR